ncbi:Ig-like domain repeat protein [Terracidiphilus gabretensis]|uniref:Ig-like domain repeat protein n=1 Tax=Terracidiphilus gabretensis TaxID=1577687 RepID=UPI00071BFF2C|nr:Ig-like domain repeat protein [Terracidiphilus gabretensis]
MCTSFTGPRIVLLRSSLFKSFFVIAAFALALAISRPAFGQAVTTTTLSVTTGGSATTSVQAGTVITLTATVVSGSTPIMPGQVAFCDASVSYCTDIHQVGIAQLTTNGKAVYKFRPGGGSHSYKAVFLGTHIYAGSSSSASSLDVTGPFISVTSISAAVTNGDDWVLNARVSGGVSFSGSSSPTGTISFLDTSNSDAVLATAPLAASTQELGFASSYSPSPQPEAIADFNLDGIPDIVDAYGNVLLGKGDGTFSPDPGESSFNSNFYGVNAIAVADFNLKRQPWNSRDAWNGKLQPADASRQWRWNIWRGPDDRYRV